MHPTHTLRDHAIERIPRPPTRVLVDGAGPLAELMHSGLTSAGYAVETGSLEVDRVDLALRSGESQQRPALVLILAEIAVAPTRWGTWRRHAVPHLPVLHDSGHVSVGPVVVPGAPCLGCLDLHRSDRDPRWVATLAHWSGARSSSLTAPEVPLLGVGLTLLMIRNLLDNGRHLRGVSLEMAPPEPWVVARHWSLHPRCRCAAPAVTMGP